MRLEGLYHQIIGENRGTFQEPVFLFLRGFSWFYSGAQRFRQWAYRRGFFSTQRLDCPVISVGNLTMGGTGKTPLVMKIARLLQEAGRKPAILSRGYGGNSRASVNVVSGGDTVLLSPAEAGDEPVMMAERLRGVPVLTGPDRYRTGLHALKHFDADTLILDDGFQHLALHRDVNLLLLPEDSSPANGRVFPAGRLRELPGAARRADAVCLSADSPALEDWRSFLGADCPVVRTSLRITSLARIGESGERPAKSLHGRRVAAFCGLADPERFRGTLRQAGADVAFFQPFPDHHVYTGADLRRVGEAARSAGAGEVLTTEKDAVKLKTISFGLPLWAVRVELEIMEAEERFLQLLMPPGGVGRVRSRGNAVGSHG